MRRLFGLLAIAACSVTLSVGAVASAPAQTQVTQLVAASVSNHLRFTAEVAAMRNPLPSVSADEDVLNAHATLAVESLATVVCGVIVFALALFLTTLVVRGQS